VLLDLLDHTIEIGIASAETSCNPIPATLNNLLAVHDHIELSGLTGDELGFRA
jgi:hypothetical protein